MNIGDIIHESAGYFRVVGIHRRYKTSVPKPHKSYTPEWDRTYCVYSPDNGETYYEYTDGCATDRDKVWTRGCITEEYHANAVIELVLLNNGQTPSVKQVKNKSGVMDSESMTPMTKEQLSEELRKLMELHSTLLALRSSTLSYTRV